MAYRELAPSSDVYSLVACRWMRQAAEDGSSDSILVLPDGCVDLLWREGELVLAGLDRTARPSPVSPGERILGLRLRPGVAGAVLGMPASEVLDVHLRLEELLGPSARELAERLGETEGDDEAFELLERRSAPGSKVAPILWCLRQPGASASPEAASTAWPNRSGSASASSGGAFTSA